MNKEWPFKDADVADFLQHNPQFFEEYADLLANIFVPHPHDGEVIPLAKRQMLTLREKNHQLENTLHRWMHYGKENDQLSKKIHELTLRLLAARNQNAAFATIQQTLPSLFNVSHLALRLWHPFMSGSTIKVGNDTQTYFTTHPHAHCAATVPNEMLQWLDDHTHILQSFAILPLRGDTLFGALILGSVDRQRFSAEHDTIYLERLSELLTEAILSKK